MIEARGLTKRFGATLAVDDLSFEVRPGVVTGFLGPNGAGKSTTMRMILGLDRPTSGVALVNGEPYAKAKTPLSEVGALLDPQDVHGGRTARAHLTALAASNGLPGSRVDAVLELTGLTDVAGRRIKGFSLGMEQRLGIAAAMLGDPGVLLFDEPVNGLDPEGILWIRTFMRRLAAQGRTVLVSSHLMSEMALTADHLVVIGRGRLLAETSTKAFVDAYSQGQVRVRSERQDDLERLIGEQGHQVTKTEGYLEVTGMSTDEVAELAFGNQIMVRELFAQTSSLEAAFMQMTRDSVDFHAGASDAQPPPDEADGAAARPPAPRADDEEVRA
jgi:ABC-2 type transport system ATP-binding protein